MNDHRRPIFYIFGIAGALIGFSLFSLHVQSVHAQDPAPTPTYDPLAQPELPPDPTELEMGRYLFWRHCMPCHGDVGQGLTDDFRALWEDHANCWERGCHGGKKDDEGFHIPTVIPAIVTADHLNQFASEEELFEFLKATHPPQYPGFLEEQEYHDLAKILLSMNERSPEEIILEPTVSPVPTSTSAPAFTSTPTSVVEQAEAPSTVPLVIAGFGIMLILVLALGVFLKSKRNAD
jgi:hypothetical protein